MLGCSISPPEQVRRRPRRGRLRPRRQFLSPGPALIGDLQWWAGWTGAQVKAALEQLPTTEVDLGGQSGIVLAGDEAPEPRSEPWPALLPALDPTAMGWRERDWFLG